MSFGSPLLLASLLIPLLAFAGYIWIERRPLREGIVFPNLAAGNIGYKLVQRLGGAETIGPILMGMGHPVSVLQHGTTVAELALTCEAKVKCG